ncbi:MAG: hypothetical protein H7210_14365 [Pyrinomonadaceae bacterium]|nr:hypothetical protein [Phycisphaerales bacterium]
MPIALHRLQPRVREQPEEVLGNNNRTDRSAAPQSRSTAILMLGRRGLRSSVASAIPAAAPGYSAELRICVANCNCDDFANSQDCFDFLGAFFAGC